MNFIDFIILAVVVCLLALIIYFSFIKKKDGCRNCAYRRTCREKKEVKKDKDRGGKCSECGKEDKK